MERQAECSVCGWQAPANPERFYCFWDGTPICHDCARKDKRVTSTPEQPAEDTPHVLQSDEEECERLLIMEMMRRLK